MGPGRIRYFASRGYIDIVPCRLAFPGLGIEPEAFAVVGIGAFFAGGVQAPVTGIVRATEMTAAFTTLLPMLAACFAAMLVANLLRSPPILVHYASACVRGLWRADFPQAGPN